MESAGVFIAKGNCAGTLNDFFSDHLATVRGFDQIAGRLIVNDALTYVALCAAGNGVAQLIDLTIEPLLKSGKLINLFPEWTDELFPLYVYYPSRHFVPGKLRVFLDFLVSSLQGERPLLFA